MSFFSFRSLSLLLLLLLLPFSLFSSFHEFPLTRYDESLIDTKSIKDGVGGDIAKSRNSECRFKPKNKRAKDDDARRDFTAKNLLITMRALT
jgi:hypothetical protein